MPHHSGHRMNASRSKCKRFEEKYLSLLRAFVEATSELQEELEEDEEEDSCSSSEDNDSPVIKQAPRKWRRKNILMDSDDDDESDECDTEDETVEMLEDPTLQDLIINPKYISWVKLSKHLYPNVKDRTLKSFRRTIRERLLEDDDTRDCNDFKSNVTAENLKIILQNVIDRCKLTYKEPAREFLETKYPVLVKYLKKT